MQFKINITDLEFIIGIITEPSLMNKLIIAKAQGEYLAKGIYPTGKYMLDFSKDDVSSIVELLSDFMLSSGIDSDGEINATGIRIESIIDTFM